MDVHEEILALRRRLERANFLYYVKDAPEISDFEYDALLRRLEELEAALDVLVLAVKLVSAQLARDERA